MNRHLTARAIVRATWFAELSIALDDGERVLAELMAEGFSPDETERLRLRLAALRIQLGRINRVGLSEERVVGPAWPADADAAVAPSPSLHPDWLPRRD
jgi:hypothetical protein